MGKCSVREEWFHKTDSLGYKISKWAQKGKKKNEFFCIACCVSVNVSKGFQAVAQHYTGQRHIKSVKSNLHSTQCQLAFSDGIDSDAAASTSDSVPILQSSGGPAQTVTTVEAVQSSSADGFVSVKHGTQPILHYFKPRHLATKAEVVWALTMVAKNLSAQSCQGIGDIFKTMFPAGVQDDFSLSPKKFSYLVSDALGPFFRELMLLEAEKEFFSIQFDETTNTKGKKELQIQLRFWSNSKNEIVTRHLETVFIGNGKAETLFKSICSALDNGSLSLKRLISVGSDGPVVNHKVHFLLNEEVKTVKSKSLLPVGTCNLHHVNNTFLKGLEAFGSDVPDLIISVFYFFRGWPTRQEQYEKSQDEKKVPKHAFIKHTSTRWLTLIDAVMRILEQWPALMHYFLQVLPQRTSTSTAGSYRNIVSLLRKKTMKAEFLFIVSSCEIFVKFSKLFQKEEPLIHVLQAELNDLLTTLQGRVCKSPDCKDPFSEENLLHVRKVECGHSVLEEIKKLNEREELEFRIGVRRHYVACGQYLLNKANKVLKNFKCLHPREINNPEICVSLTEIAKALPEEINIDTLLDEWRLLRTEKSVSDLAKTEMRVDHFWRYVFGIENAVGIVKHPTIQKVVKMCLSVPHGGADVEREFSLSGRILSEDRASMTERSLNARLNVIDGLKMYENNPTLVPITDSLLKMAQNAHKNYEEYQQQKKKEEGMNKKKDEDERKRRAEEDDRKKIVKKTEWSRSCKE